MLPSPSVVDRTMVSPVTPVFPGDSGVDASCGSTLPQSEAAYDSDSSRPRGTDTKSGSALYRYRSAYASFFASTNRCQYSGLVGPSDANVFPGAHFCTHA